MFQNIPRVSVKHKINFSFGVLAKNRGVKYFIKDMFKSLGKFFTPKQKTMIFCCPETNFAFPY